METYMLMLFPLFSVPEDWILVQRVGPLEEVELTFALKQQNVNQMEELLKLVSDPDSQQYGIEHLFLYNKKI